MTAPAQAEVASVDRQSRPLASHIVPVVVALVVTFGHVFFGAWQWSQLAVRSWDLAIFTQLLQRYAALEAPIVSVKGDGYNLLGDHFHPLLVVLAPVFALFPHAFTLVVVQGVCFGVAAGVFSAAARRRLGGALGAALGLAFGFSWALQYTAEVQFHEVALAVPLLTLSLVAVLDGRWNHAVAWAAPLVFVKEDLGLTVAAVGVLIVLRARKPIGLWLVAWGVGWFAVATLVVLPLLNPAGGWAYGGSANPIAVFADPAGLFSPSKGLTLALMVVATAGVFVRSPLAIVLVPTLAWRFLSTNYGYWGPSWHYSAVLIPVLFCALLDGERLLRGSRRRWARVYGRAAPVASVCIAVVLLPFLPFAAAISPAAWERPQRADAAAALSQLVPRSAVVETDIGLMNYLVDDHELFWLGNANPVPDCVVIDTVAGGTPSEWGDVVAVAERLHPETSFVERFDRDGYQLACRG